MKQDDDQFSLQDVDQWIEQLAQYASDETCENNRDVQLVKILRHHYEKERQQKKLQDIWEVISQQYNFAIRDAGTEVDINTLQKKSEKNLRQRQARQISDRRNFSRWGIWLSVAVLVLVIGSFAMVISHITQIQSIPGSDGNHPIICTSTPTNITTPRTAVPTSSAAPAYCIEPTVTPTVAPGSIVKPGIMPKPTATPEVMPTSKPTPTTGT